MSESHSDLVVIDEHGHVLAQCTVFINDVATQAGILSEDVSQHVADGGPFRVDRRAGHVSLQVLRENHPWHEPMLTVAWVLSNRYDLVSLHQFLDSH